MFRLHSTLALACVALPSAIDAGAAANHATPETRIATLARAVDVAANSGRSARDAAVAAASAHTITVDEWLDVAGLDDLAWRGGNGFEVKRPFTPQHFAVLEAGLRASGSQGAKTRPLLQARTSSEASLAAALRAASRLAPPADPLIFGDLTEPFGSTRSRALRSALQDAVGTWCVRHEVGHTTVRDGLEELPTAFAAAYVQGALAGADKAALERGIACIGVFPALDAFAVARVGDLAQALAPPFDGLDADPIEELLHSDDPSVAIECTRTLRALDDVSSADGLIALLERTQHAGVLRSTVEALERITGERLGANPRLWRAWHMETVRWKDTELPRIRQELETGQRQRVNRALLEIARQRAHRHGTGPIVIKATRTKDVATLETAIAVLGQLATRQTVLRLIQLLGHDDERVQRAAYRSLRFATGRDLGGDADAWREEFITNR